MIKLVGFDLDGTLLNSLPDLTDGVNYGLRSVGLPERTQGQIRTYIGNGARLLIRKAAAPVEDEAVLNKIRLGFDEYYRENYCNKSRVYEGINDLFAFLKQEGIQVAVLSNKPDEFVKVILERLFPDYPFGGMMGQRADFPNKPDPAGFRYLQTKLDCNNEECLYVGDSDVDIILAKRAGVTSVGVTWGYREREELEREQADYIVNTAAEIMEIIKTYSK